MKQQACEPSWVTEAGTSMNLDELDAQQYAIKDAVDRPKPARVNNSTEKPWLDQYEAWAQKTNDANLSYHRSGGKSVISIALGNRVAYSAHENLLFPNLYIVLLGEKRLSRKTTAINLTKQVIKRFAKLEGRPLLYPSKITPEALYPRLQKQPQGIFHFTEFGHVLESWRRDYMSDFPNQLTLLYDCGALQPFEYEQKSETYRIENPLVVILGGTTVEAMQEALKSKFLRDGFCARILWVARKPSTERKGIRERSRTDTKGADDLAQDLKTRIDRLLDGRTEPVEMDFSSVADQYDEWEIDFENRLATEPDDTLKTFLGGLQATVPRLAIIHEISLNPNPGPEISPAALVAAIKDVEGLADDLETEILSDLSAGDRVRAGKRILAITAYKKFETGGASVSDILAHLRDKSLEPYTDKALKDLVDSGQIEEFRSPTQRTVRYKAIPNL